MSAAPGKLRIALCTKPATGLPTHADCVAGAEAAARLCEDLGHRVTEAAPKFDWEGLSWAMQVIIGGNLRSAVDFRLASLGRNLQQGDLERVTAEWYEMGGKFTARDYARAITIVHGIGRRFGAFFSQYDVLLSPVLAEPPLPLGSTDMMRLDLKAYNERLFRLIPFTPQFNVSGGPGIALPLHWTAGGLPVGVHFGADYGNEAVLLRLAAQLEHAQPWHDKRPPL
jgi:amidase/6-aminohexanoate-cyclic-dimer hydrolase